MSKEIRRWLLVGLALFLIGAVLFWVSQAEAMSALTEAAGVAAFLILFPLGLMLITSCGLPQREGAAAEAAAAALMMWAVATLAYFGAGFAFQFGGLANVNADPDFAELYWNWSPLSSAAGTGWGVIGLRGWALLGRAGTPGVYDLFLRHIALLGIVIVIPAFILHRRLNIWGMVVYGLLAGGLLYPVAGNWIWSGGWLSSLGRTLGLGHGFVDAGIATPLAMAGIICLAALMVWPGRPPEANIQPVGASSGALPGEALMPPAYRPLLGFLGLALALWGWAFLSTADHIPAAAPIVASQTALNGALSALVAGLSAEMRGGNAAK